MAALRTRRIAVAELKGAEKKRELRRYIQIMKMNKIFRVFVVLVFLGIGAVLAILGGIKWMTHHSEQDVVALVAQYPRGAQFSVIS